MNDFRQTPHKDFVRVPVTERFGRGDRWSGVTVERKPRWPVLATWLALTAGLGAIALVD